MTRDQEAVIVSRAWRLRWLLRWRNARAEMAGNGSVGPGSQRVGAEGGTRETPAPPHCKLVALPAAPHSPLVRRTDGTCGGDALAAGEVGAVFRAAAEGMSRRRAGRAASGLRLRERWGPVIQGRRAAGTRLKEAGIGQQQRRSTGLDGLSERRRKPDSGTGGGVAYPFSGMGAGRSPPGRRSRSTGRGG